MIIDSLENEIQLKIVYFGPALSGKTTSLKTLFNHFGKKKDVCSIESSVGRTLFFDYGTVSFQNEYWKVKTHIYSTTGQDFYIVTRPTTLKAVDGIIFVADSQRKTYERNIISWEELAFYFGNNLIKLPKIIAFNKQDLPDKYSHSAFLERINYDKYDNKDVLFTIALNGEGILESFENVLSSIFNGLYKSKLIKSIC